MGDFLEWRFDRVVRGAIAGVLWLGTLSLLAGSSSRWPGPSTCSLGAPRACGLLVCGGHPDRVLRARRHPGRGLVNVLQLVSQLVGFALAVPFAWSAAGGWSGLRAAAGAEHAADFGSVVGMGVSGILGLAVMFVPSFIVSPGLIQKAFGGPHVAAPRARRRSGNAAALAVFAFVPALLGMAMRAARARSREPGAGAARASRADVLPPWLGGLALAALFAAELSAADAVLFMLSTSLSRDLYQTLLRPKATDAELLKVGRLAILIGGALGAGLALLLPSVATALRLFYGVLTAALFVPLVVGLLSRRPGASHARLAITASLAATLVLFAVLRGRPEAEWLPSVGGILAAACVFATAWLGKRPAREAGASIESI